VLHLALLQTGTIDEVPLYPRLVVETSIRHHAHAVLLAHNHPGGNADPSQADYDTTIRLVNTLSGIQIRLMDHLIFSDTGVYSMIRESRFTQAEAAQNFSYIVKSRNVPGRCGMLREEADEWISLNDQDFQTYE